MLALSSVTGIGGHAPSSVQVQVIGTMVCAKPGSAHRLERGETSSHLQGGARGLII
jgi:hypothetical protein